MVMFTETKVQQIVENGVLSTDEKIAQLLEFDSGLCHELKGKRRWPIMANARTLLAKVFLSWTARKHGPQSRAACGKRSEGGGWRVFQKARERPIQRRGKCTGVDKRPVDAVDFLVDLASLDSDRASAKSLCVSSLTVTASLFAFSRNIVGNPAIEEVDATRAHGATTKVRALVPLSSRSCRGSLNRGLCIQRLARGMELC